MKRNRKLARLITLPSRIPATLAFRAGAIGAAVLPLLAFGSSAFAQATNTLGGRMTAASTDLGTGAGYVLELIGYIVGGFCLLVAAYTFWQHNKNPNGQHKLGYAIASLLAGGAFLSASAIGTYSSQTVSGISPTNNGTAAQMQFNQ